MSSENRFTYKSIEELTAELSRIGAHIPLSEDHSVLSRPVSIGGISAANSIAVHPMEGFDGEYNGAPGELTYRRYERFARGGAGLFWFEATAVCSEGRSSKRQLWINRENLDEYKRIVDRIHENSNGAPVICQLTHSGRFSKPENTPAPIIAYHNPLLNERLAIDPDYPTASDDYLDSLHDRYIEAAGLAKSAGFDGVDIKSCHRYLMSELLSAYTRGGKYGGSYENRTRLLRSVVRDTASLFAADDFIIGTRMSVTDCIPYPYGFCTKETGEIDLTEAKRLICELHGSGLSLLNVSMGTPYYNPHINRPYDGETEENPLCGVARMISGASELKAANPDVITIGTGYSYLRGYSPYAAAGAIADNAVDMVGFGRMAFAYPDFARDMINGSFDRRRTCVTCGKCVQLMRRCATAGCPVRDDVYTPIYKEICGGKPELF